MNRSLGFYEYTHGAGADGLDSESNPKRKKCGRVRRRSGTVG